ncbi:hypothetical protein ONZ45_g6959 [Pleurotus djamor]|nr:hypothetical protein ONZ45_g6959 [Pleurotus djamor]
MSSASPMPIVYSGDVLPRGRFFKSWERTRHSKEVHWFIECFAEALGAFLYTWAGVGSTAAWVVGNVLQLENVGWFAYAFGILLAIGICSGTSGGHFNPCVSIAQVVYRGFPPWKAARYIVSQILGGYLACLLAYAQWRTLIIQAEEALAAAGALEGIQFTPLGTGGILALYATPGAPLGIVWVNEFVTDFVLGLAIWACIDPTNVLIPPQAAPLTISFAYAAAIWSYSSPGLAANAARDVGGRLAALTIYGRKASGGSYAAIAALTSIPAMLLAVFVYETMLSDSDRVIPRASLEFLTVHKNHRRLGDATAGAEHHSHSQGSYTDSEKPKAEHLQA